MKCKISKRATSYAIIYLHNSWLQSLYTVAVTPSHFTVPQGHFLPDIDGVGLSQYFVADTRMSPQDALLLGQIGNSGWPQPPSTRAKLHSMCEIFNNTVGAECKNIKKSKIHNSILV